MYFYQIFCICLCFYVECFGEKRINNLIQSNLRSWSCLFPAKLDLSFYIISIASTASKKIKSLIHSMKFLSPEVAPYFYKSTIQIYVEYYCHVWVRVPSCYQEFSNKLKKQICRSVSLSLVASLEPFTHCQNVASLSLFYWHYFGRCSSELA